MQAKSLPPMRLKALQKSFIIGVLSPVAAHLLALKTIRIIDRGDLDGVLHLLDLFKSELLFLTGFAVFGLALLALSNQKNVQRLLLFGLQIGALVISFTDFAAHRFFQSTGSTLDFQLLNLVFGNFDDIWQVIADEFHFARTAPFGLYVIVLMTLPWLLLSLTTRKPSQSSVTSSSPQSTTKSLRWLSAATIFAALLFITSAVPPFLETDVPFSRASLINIVLSGMPVAGEGDRIASNRLTLTELQLTATPGPKTKKNVAIIVLESTRARSTSVYNDTLATTPFLRSLAAKSLVAERAYAVVPHTSKALVAILCGIEPQLNMPITEALPAGLPTRCLAELLAQQGYDTAFFQSATENFENRSQLIDNMGFEKFVSIENMPQSGFEKTNYFGFEDNIMLNPSKQWLKSQKNKPFLATYLTLTPHHNYKTPKHHKIQNFSKKKLLNQYLNAINYTDGFIEKLISQYKELGLYENTIFVFVGDHGEGFGEHGRNQHDNVIYEEGIHIPLMIYDPENPQGLRISNAVSQIDIIPTLLDLLGFEVRNAELPGINMTQSSEERRVFAHCWFEKRCMASVSKNDKYIHHFNTQPDELYDMILDPLETKNIASIDSKMIQHLRDTSAWRVNVLGMYKNHHNKNLAPIVFDTAPPFDHHLDATFGDYLRLVGYSVQPEKVRRGDRVKITYVFNTIKRVPEDWNLFVHGVGDKDRMLLLDHVPAKGMLPVKDWMPDKFIVDEHEISIPANYKSNSLKIMAGFFHPTQGRAPVTGSVTVDKVGRAEVVEIPIIR